MSEIVVTNELVDYDYIGLIDEVEVFGNWADDRTSVGRSRQMFGGDIRFHTRGKLAPLIQCRTMSPRIAFEELMWMLRGSTDVSELQAKGIHIWDGNSTRAFLDARGLERTPENTIGKAYGYQYRSFGGITDQVAKVFNELKTNPTSRRHVISIWNPNDADQMALEPCFWGYTFVYINGVLNLDVTSRSSDVVFGLPYNLAFSYFWLLLFSRALGYEMGSIRLSMANAHYYENQLPLVNKLLDDDLYDSLATKQTPYCTITKQLETLDDVLSVTWDDIKVHDWVRGDKLVEDHIEMAV